MFQKLFFSLAFLLAFSFSYGVKAQDKTIFMTKEGKISFFSEAPLENIEALNSKVTSLIDLNKGDIQFSVPIESFKFDKALMEEHFNENYMHTKKYPKATFKGSIQSYDPTALTKDGTYTCKVKGMLDIHGKSKEYTTEVVFQRSGEDLTAKTTFDLSISDHDIEIPKMVFKNIAEVVRIKVDLLYKPYK